ncbi:MAG: SPOR domain-containing protein [Bacteroidales bacterium]|nr:SPOR domain-containing protein [Bacteroidales bacterium]MBN2756838.1 SPOR domain-containing protein [Bacteroidales bacterium]
MKNIILISILYFIAILGNAQSTVELSQTGIFSGVYSSNAGQVYINQNPDLQKIINNHISINKENYSLKGWRVQIFLGSGKNARFGANSAKSTFLSKYPNINAYLDYNAPYFKIKVGNFRTKLEAEAFKMKISNSFPNSWVVESDIEKPD